MKVNLTFLLAATLCLSLVPAHAQFGPGGGGRGGMMGGPSGLRLGGSMKKLFGDQASFTADLEISTTDETKDTMVIPGKMAALDGKARMEMDLARMKSARMPAGAAEQMKMIGMDKMVMISRPDKKVSYQVYPGLQAYVENVMQEGDETKPASDYAVQFTEQGKETMAGHPCVKNKAVVTDQKDKEKKFEFMVWNATDLKNFPVKILMQDKGSEVVMAFDNVKFDKPATAQFEPPSDAAKYTDMNTMVQTVLTKRMGGAGGPGGAPGRP
jgi:hypothetical protein